MINKINKYFFSITHLNILKLTSFPNLYPTSGLIVMVSFVKSVGVFTDTLTLFKTPDY